MEDNMVGQDFGTIGPLAVEEGIHQPDGHIPAAFVYPEIPIDCTELSEYQAMDKQLAEYFKKASNMNWSPFLAFLSSTFCAGEKRHRIRAFGICCLLSLLLNMLLLLFAGKMQQRPSTKKSDNTDSDDEYIDLANRQRIGLLCIGAYISNISLTFTSVCLAVVLRKTYAWFFLLFLPIMLAAYYSVARNGIRNGVPWGVVQYESHRPDMSFFFNLSYEITQASFAALAGTLLGYQKQCKDIPVRAPESILLCAAVMGLFVMTICTVPPAVALPSERSSLVSRSINSVTYLLLQLVSVSLFLAVVKISGWHLTVPLIVASAIIIAIAWFASPWLATVAPGIFAGPGLSEQDKEARRIAGGEQSLRWVNFYSVMSGVLMASYSSNIGGGTKSLSWQYIASMDFMYSAFWAYMAHILVMREACDDRHAAVKVSSILATAFLIVAVACVALLIVLKPHEITSSFSSAVPVHPCPS